MRYLIHKALRSNALLPYPHLITLFLHHFNVPLDSEPFVKVKRSFSIGANVVSSFGYRKERDGSWVKKDALAQAVLRHHLFREMTLHLLCTTFLTGWMDSTPSLVRALTCWIVVLMPWMHDLQGWTHVSPSLRMMLVLFVSALTFHHHPHRFRLLLYFVSKSRVFSFIIMTFEHLIFLLIFT